MMKSKRNRDLARIHIAKKELDLSDQEYRAIIAGIMAEMGSAGKPSSANLTHVGRRRLIRTFIDMGWQQDYEPDAETEYRYEVPGAPGMITRKQAGKIAHLEETLGWQDNSARLLGFIKRTLGEYRSVTWLTNRQASQVITALNRYAESDAA